jgi:endoglucanase
VPQKSNRRFISLFLGSFLLVLAVLACTAHPPETELQSLVDQALAASWAFYKTNFILPDGRVRRPDSGHDTVSEGQAYALLRAVWSGDQATFERCFNWAESHLSQRKLVTPHPDPLPSRGEGKIAEKITNDRHRGSHLLAWHWGRDAHGRWGVLDANSASDADLDYALALILAHRRWERPDYLEQARLVLRDILDRETCRDAWGRLWLTPGDWVACGPALLLNPSYFSPAWYQVFFEVTQDRRWLELAESAYAGLEIVSRSLGQQTGVGLVPDWCLLIGEEHCRPAPDRSAAFGWDAIRVPWRVGLAGLWFGDPRSKDFLSRTFLPFSRAQLQAHGRLYAIYDYVGQPLEPYDSPVLYAGLVAGALAAGDRPLAKQAAEKILSFYRETADGGYFNRPDDYYGNNWAWFGLAVYRGVVRP